MRKKPASQQLFYGIHRDTSDAAFVEQSEEDNPY